MATAVQLLATVGAALVLKTAYTLATFLAFYYQKPTVGRLLHGAAPYALITGASDGIGKATAKELYKRGFNVILHGRNPEKLLKVSDELKRVGTRDIRLWVEDATKSEIDFEAAVAQWEDIEITLVVNNVGGGYAKDARLDDISRSDLWKSMRLNFLFPFFLTRAILPKLRTVAGPTQIVFIGSFAGDSYLPRLTPYGASKAFLKQLSHALEFDERVWKPTNVSTMYVTVGSVVSGTHRVVEGLAYPSAEVFAKAMVDKFACGRPVVVPWLVHAIQFWLVSILPARIAERTMAAEIRKEIELMKKL